MLNRITHCAILLYEVVSWDLVAWDLVAWALVLAKSSCVAAPYPYNGASSILSINEPGLGIMGDVQSHPRYVLHWYISANTRSNQLHVR